MLPPSTDTRHPATTFCGDWRYPLRPLKPRIPPRWGLARWRHAVVIGEGGRSHSAHGLHGAAREILPEGPLAPVFAAAILAGAPEALALQLALLTLVNGVAIRQAIP